MKLDYVMYHSEYITTLPSSNWEFLQGDAAILPIHHNIPKNPSYDLTWSTIVKISLAVSTGEPRHDHTCEAVH